MNEDIIIYNNGIKYIYVISKDFPDLGKISLFISSEILDLFTENNINKIKISKIQDMYAFWKENDNGEFEEKIENTSLKKRLQYEFDLVPYDIFFDMGMIKFLVLFVYELTAIGVVYLPYNDFVLKAKKVSPEEREKFIEDRKDDLKKIKEELGVDIDLNNVNQKLNRIKIKEIQNDTLKKFWMGIDNAWYKTTNKTVYFSKKQLESRERNNCETKLHETIHYLTEHNLKFSMISQALMEGATESIAVRTYDDGTAHEKKIFGKKNKQETYCIYNYPIFASYTDYVSLIRQLEYITHADSCKSLINGDMNFLNSIKETLGISRTIKMIATLKKDAFCISEKKISKDFKKIQDDLLKGHFDKKFQQIKTKEEAMAFLEELRGFDKERVQYVKRTYEEKSHKHKIEFDPTFEDYYNDKLSKISSEFELTEQEKEINIFSRHMDKNIVCIKPQEKEEKINRTIFNYLYNQKIEQDSREPLDEQCKVIRFELDKGANFIFFIDNQNNVFYEKKVFGLTDEAEVEDIIDENINPEELLENFKKGKYGGRRIEIDVKKIVKEEADKETHLAKIGRYKSIFVKRLEKFRQKIIDRKKAIRTYDKESEEDKEKGHSWDLRNWDNYEEYVNNGDLQNDISNNNLQNVREGQER